MEVEEVVKDSFSNQVDKKYRDKKPSIVIWEIHWHLEIKKIKSQYISMMEELGNQSHKLIMMIYSLIIWVKVK